MVLPRQSAEISTPATNAMPMLARSRIRSLDTGHGVVIRECHELHAAGRDARDERGRVERAVGGRRMQVQVNRRLRGHTARGPRPTVSTWSPVRTTNPRWRW